MNDNTLSPKEQFIEEMKALSAKLDAIDKQVPWSETEPDWWVEMSEMRRRAAMIANNYGNKS